MKRLFLPMLTLAALALAPARAGAALNAYMKITGKGGQVIEGDVTIKGREGTMAVHQTAHEIVSPRDAASGLPTGKRQHKPFTIVKSIDKATPLLLNALVMNDTLEKVEIQYWRPDASGREVHYFTVTLINAQLANNAIRQASTLDPATVKLPVLEEVSFTYQRIIWTWMEGGITAMDDWETPIQ